MEFLQLWDIVFKYCFHICIGVLCTHVSDLHSCLLCEMGLNILPILTLSTFRTVNRSERAFERYRAS
jgi:hypothetical protein